MGIPIIRDLASDSRFLSHTQKSKKNSYAFIEIKIKNV